jgi:hypothetical protein
MGGGGLLNGLGRVGMVEGASEEENVRLGIMSLVVLPPWRLLHPECPPFALRKKPSWNLLCQLLRQNHMPEQQKQEDEMIGRDEIKLMSLEEWGVPVLEFIVAVLVGVDDLRHCWGQRELCDALLVMCGRLGSWRALLVPARKSPFFPGKTKIIWVAATVPHSGPKKLSFIVTLFQDLLSVPPALAVENGNRPRKAAGRQQSQQGRADYGGSRHQAW